MSYINQLNTYLKLFLIKIFISYNIGIKSNYFHHNNLIIENRLKHNIGAYLKSLASFGYLFTFILSWTNTRTYSCDEMVTFSYSIN